MDTRKMHPRNKYAEKPPDFDLLAGLYPDFKQYVTYGSNQRPRIDWTDSNATRELTRSLLYHDYGISWWIPDGQLCPTVPNRANYIHWIEDLIALAPAPWKSSGAHQVTGIDIGTGANCIYPLLGASMHGWSFVGTDITPVALEWAKWNVESNPHVSALIEVRNAVLDDATNRNANEPNHGVDNAPPPSADDVLPGSVDNSLPGSVDNALPGSVDNALPGLVDNALPAAIDDALPASGDNALPGSAENALPGSADDAVPGSADSALPASVDYDFPPSMGESEVEEPQGLHPLELKVLTNEIPLESTISSMEGTEPEPAERSLGVLVGVVSENERFDFCMCNPPFFASMEEAGLNPRTACGGTEAEMVCPGGEEAFVARIIEDSAQLKHAIHWFTTMVGRKVTLKGLTAKLWALGAAAVRTTEFVQGRTSRWGLAWSFTTPPKAALKKNSSTLKIKNDHSFMLEGLGRGSTAVDVLQGLSSQLQALGASCTVKLSDFSISGTLPDKCEDHNEDVLGKRKRETTNGAVNDGCTFKSWVFQQAPGSLLVKASLNKGSDQGALFADLFEQVEQSLKQLFGLRSQK